MNIKDIKDALGIDDTSRDTLVYIASATRGPAHTGRSFDNREEAISWAEDQITAGWTVHITIHGQVEGYELWRALSGDDTVHQT